MPAFPYDRAALVLAEATYFGKKLACQKYTVPRTTYTNWKKRLQTDNKLANLVTIQSEALSKQWQGDTIRCLKLALNTIQEGLSKHPFSYQPQTAEEKELWGNNILALSKMVKSIGDLTIAGDVLNDDSNDHY